MRHATAILFGSLLSVVMFVAAPASAQTQEAASHVTHALPRLSAAVEAELRACARSRPVRIRKLSQAAAAKRVSNLSQHLNSKHVATWRRMAIARLLSNTPGGDTALQAFLSPWPPDNALVIRAALRGITRCSPSMLQHTHSHRLLRDACKRDGRAVYP